MSTKLSSPTRVRTTNRMSSAIESPYDLRTIMQGSWTVNLMPLVFQRALIGSLPSRIHCA